MYEEAGSDPETRKLDSWRGEQACDAGIKWSGVGSCSGAGLLARSE